LKYGVYISFMRQLCFKLDELVKSQNWDGNVKSSSSPA
jgi:hypothetical protein